MLAGRRYRFLAATILSVALVHVAISQDRDPAKQREEQKKVQARVAEAARRASSTIDAMAYQRLSPKAEQKMLEEVADGLRGLSQDQIKTILEHLEAAVQAPNSAAADKEQVKAYEKHRLVVSQLRGMLVRLDVIKNLDEAAARLDRAANDQLVVNGETLAATTTTRRVRPGRVQVNPQDDLMDKQTALRDEVAGTMKEIARLFPDLPPEQKERVEKAQAKEKGAEITNQMVTTTRRLQASQFDDAAELQRRHTKELKDLAAALRSPPGSKLEALKAARDKVEKALEAQKKVSEDTAKKPDPQDENPRQRNTVDAKQAKANELATAQAKAELATRDARKAADVAAPEVAESLKPAETQQFKAEENIRKLEQENARPQQDMAADVLKSAKDELERQIAAAEMAKRDPLAAVKQAAEQIDALIKEQKAAAEKTATAEKDEAKLPEATTAQKDVAKKADELKSTPLPANPEAKAAIDKAADATKQAKTDLEKNQPAEAQPEQKAAIKALEEAKAALEQQAKAIEDRRAEIAKLEEAKKDLEKLAAAEKKVAEEAKAVAEPKAGEPMANDPMKGDPKANDPMKGDPKANDPMKGDPKANDPMKGDPKANDPMKGDPKMGEPMNADAKKPDTGDLANKQAELQPPTKEVGEKLKDVAPDAAKKVDEAGMKQEGAKTDLAKNDPKAGAEKASDAAKKLEEAAKAVDMQLAEKRGMEANDQAMLQPNNVDPMAAAQQLAKALDQANKAAEQANEAAKSAQPMDGMQPKDGQPSIAELQKQVAKQAADLKQADAAKAANEAAKSLEKGDLPAAVESQQKALDALNKAAMAQPKDGMPMAGAPKDGMPMGGMPMGGMPMGGMPMGGMPMGGIPMAQTPGELAQTQQKLIDATKALQQSQQATNAAQAALAQAQANAPMAVQPQLNMAQDALNMAGNQLGMGQPGQAGMNQAEAANAIQQALNALNAAAMANGQMATQPGQNPMASTGMQPGMGMGMQPGMGMGMQPGMGMANGMQPGQPGQPGMGQPNTGVSEGDMNGQEKLKNTSSSGNGQTGEGGFIGLRKRERDKVQQPGEAQFPAEFRELIKQYNINIKNTKPVSPAAPPGSR